MVRYDTIIYSFSHLKWRYFIFSGKNRGNDDSQRRGVQDINLVEFSSEDSRRFRIDPWLSESNFIY